MARIPLYVEEEDYYTPEWALDEEEWADGRCLAATSPEQGAAVLPLPPGPPADDAARPDTWHVHWVELAWLWGFVIVLALVHAAGGSGSTASTRQRTGIYPVDSFGGYTTRAGRPGDALLPRSDAWSSSAWARRADRRPHRLGAEVLMAAAASRPSALPYVSWSSATWLVVPADGVADRLRVAAGAQGTRAGVPGLPEARGRSSGRRGRRRARPLLHDLGHARAARGVPRARLHVRADARRRRRDPPSATRVDGEDVLMATRPRTPRPARPLAGYRDIGAEDVRHSRQARRPRLDHPRVMIALLPRAGR